MTLTVESTSQLPLGMMEAVSGLRLKHAVDRYRDYVLFWITDDHYAIVGPYDYFDERVVNRWFSSGWSYRTEDSDETVIMHVEAYPIETYTIEMARLL